MAPNIFSEHFEHFAFRCYIQNHFKLLREKFISWKFLMNCNLMIASKVLLQVKFTVINL